MHPAMSRLDAVVSVLAVVGDDRAVLADYLQEVHQVLRAHFRYFEMVLVDNASADGSAEVLREALTRLPGMRWLRLSRRHDGDVAWVAALEHCMGDYVVLMDPYHDPPGLIPDMIALAARTSAVVVGRRTREPSLARWHQALRRAFFRVASGVLRQRLSPEVSYFRVYPRQVVAALTRIKNRRRHLKYFSSLVGYKQVEFPVEPIVRGGGRPAPGLLASVERGCDLMISNSIQPLRWATRLGFAASLLNLLYLGYIFVVFLVRERLAEGWLTQSVMNTVMFLCLFFVLAVFGEYVGRILEEAQDQPLYFLEVEMDSPITGGHTDDVLNVA